MGLYIGLCGDCASVPMRARCFLLSIPRTPELIEILLYSLTLALTTSRPTNHACLHREDQLI